jgi:septal ring factor EnvC (AmiA/AmiB activator)
LTNPSCSCSLLASLQQSKERAEALEAKLKISEEARAKAQADADSIEELRQRLSKAESALSDKIAEQISQEQCIIDHLEAQRRCFFRKLFLYLETFLHAHSRG